MYTDGSCLGNPGPGGYGVVMRFKQHNKELSEGFTHTTNNRMELTAAIAGLSALKSRCVVDLYTDSVYVKDGITKWLSNWKSNGWRTAAKKPVANQDLWEQLDQAVSDHHVNWYWVKGHSGDPGNERADELANQGVSSVCDK